MKRAISLVICLILMLSFVIPTSAEGVVVTVSASASSVNVGDLITYTVSLSATNNATSGSIAVTFGSGLELVSGEFLRSDSMLSYFDTSTNLGGVGFISATDLTGDYFRLVLRAKEAGVSSQNVSFTVELRNGASSVGSGSASKTVSVYCITHNFENWNSTGNAQHTRTCLVCGYVETANHTWDSGSVTKEATCKEDGIITYQCTECYASKKEAISKTDNHTYGAWSITVATGCTTAGTQSRTCSICKDTQIQTIAASGHSFDAWGITKEPTCTENGIEARTCTKCGETETKVINALGHSFSTPVITKQPTCTESGTQSGTCTRCGETTSQTIKPTGHSFGSWTNSKAATCTEAGVQKRVCSKCNIEETRNTASLGHDFETPSVVKEATIYSTGLIEGKCKRCGESTSQIIPCTVKNEKTGIVFEADEGVFSIGTEIVVEEITKDNTNYNSAKNALSEITGSFVLYDISAVFNGAKIQPKGKVTVTFKIPNGYGNNIALYYISNNGTVEKIEAELSQDGKTIKATLEHFSLYTICNLDAPQSTENETNTPGNSKPTESTAVNTSQAIEVNADDTTTKEGSNRYTLWIIIAINILLAAGITLFTIYKKRSSKN